MEELFFKNYLQKKRKKGRAGVGKSLRKRGRKTKEKTMGWKCSSKGKGMTENGAWTLLAVRRGMESRQTLR